ncbi:MAG: zinc-dependent metalloprotease [Bifidobacteriaceae bacterium]|jgi:putative hydrolase|nr:zinc-dependent metalloprotease [Bifidobacteriaceae bacterium]
MSVTPGASGGSLPPEFIELLRSLFGPEADQAIEAFQESGFDAQGLLDAAGLTGDPGALRAIAAQVARLARSAKSGQVVDWDLAHDAARQASLAKGPDPAIAASERATVVESFTLVGLWLDQVTELGGLSGPVDALSAAGWIDATEPRWKELTMPLAISMRRAMETLAEQHAAEHPGVGEMTTNAFNALGGMSSGLFGMQLGQALGLLSREVFGYTDTGLPLGERGAQALLPTAVKTFAADTALPLDEVQLFLAAREAAHVRLFTHVPWLADRLLGAVESYAAGIAIDLGALESAIRDIDPPTPENIRQAMSSGVFAPALTEPQKAALDRLETALALVEGWVSVVTQHALERNLPDVASLSEMMRRRRASGGPAEHALATLVGLELRPRRARQAGVLWETVTAELGPLERDQLWSHPDLLPTSQDLDTPEAFLLNRAERAQADAAIDAEIAAFFNDNE